MNAFMNFNAFLFLNLNHYTIVPPRTSPDFKLHKIMPVITYLKNKFVPLYNPSEVLSVDEAMVIFKGFHSAKLYIPNKPVKQGFKLWSLADKNGYLSNFDVNVGKKIILQPISLCINTKRNCFFSFHNKK
ncbi:unnamed protein product [Gordionus sp. m RMFG-2023]